MRRPLALLAALTLAGGVAVAQQDALPLGEYVAELERIETALRTADLEDARLRAQALLATPVAYRAETIAPDPTVLGPAGGVKDRPDALRQADRIAALVGRLREGSGEAATSNPDRDRLERLRRQQAAKPLHKGGEVEDPRLKPVTLPERVVEVLNAVWDGVADIYNTIRDWLRKLWPEERSAKGEPSGFGLNVAVVALVALVTALLAVLAVRALRRGAAEEGEEASSAVATSSRDADPLSREANEWERYAAELAAAGRRREAIRAWYHAVLVTLFRAGTLHYQRGRTNWEYASRIAPEAAWRPAFLEITRAFDREWYGRDTSTAEALRSCADGAKRILRSLRGAEAA